MDIIETNTININILIHKIENLQEQIKLRQSIPESNRTEKQSIKLDNLLYELNKLYEEYKTIKESNQ